MLSGKEGSVLEKFYTALEEVLKMKIANFLKEFSDILPKYEHILENESIENILKYLKDGIHYLIVTDRKGKMRGIITYIDFMMMFGKKRSTALFAPFSSVTRSLRKARMPLKTLSEMKASDIMCIAVHLNRVFIYQTVSGTVWFITVSAEPPTGAFRLPSGTQRSPIDSCTTEAYKIYEPQHTQQQRHRKTYNDTESYRLMFLPLHTCPRTLRLKAHLTI